jgi:putative transposase
LVLSLENWSYSSFVDYAGLQNGTICDKELAFKSIGFDKNNFITESYKEIHENLIPKLFYRTDRW